LRPPPTTTVFPYTTLFRSAFQRAEQSARINFFNRPRRILRRQSVEPPALERHLFERAFGENVVRVIVRVDEPRQHEMVARVDYRSEEHTSELQSRGHLVCR